MSAGGARDNRAFLGAAVRHLAGLGVRQFLDIGTGLPTQENVHQVAQRADPAARVVYVDNDTVVVSHARALLAATPGTVAIKGDLREPGRILADPELRGLIDLDRPVAVLLLLILHFIRDDREVRDILRQITSALAPGSYLVISHGTAGADVEPGQADELQQVYARALRDSLTPRPAAEIAGFLDGLRLVGPGVVPVTYWSPEAPPYDGPDLPGALGVVARVP
ncbi:SAM-dependent methyltransferase [Bailinhaonella thermotolerans]|uniref:SAM-dependent methyltransferase n=1 Tax=Bailinhaonella thermotolerans TaxID=1070861 RepID=A0A3A4AY01_9ACTN|nr:SAM-dependent methyltransferase [Bailinhaonella thermotolerans]RJL35542.1 SAM-dependent methyltransferase [Bailinhaonella thermotolerans]